MACLDTSFLLDAGGRRGRRLTARAREKLASLVEANESLTTTRFNVAELWVGVERTGDRPGEIFSVETMLEPLTVLDFDESSECLGVSPRIFMLGDRHVETWTSSSHQSFSCTANDW
jgi:predicted nucleic acid-binding protein